MDREELISSICKGCDDDCGEDNDCIKGDIACLIVQKRLESKVINTTDELRSRIDQAEEYGFRIIDMRNKIKELEKKMMQKKSEFIALQTENKLLWMENSQIKAEKSTLKFK